MGCGCVSYRVTDIKAPIKKGNGIISGVKFLFPKPPHSPNLYEQSTRIFYLPSNNRRVPVLYLNYPTSNKLIYYLHGNCEDIGHVYKLLKYLSSKLSISAIAIEYPGYGFYDSIKTNADVIDEDSVNVLNFIVDTLGVPLNRIIIMGRSIGTGPATMLASMFRALALILISPFSSIKEVCKNIVGTIGYFLVKQRWESEENMKSVKIPSLLIHGRADTLIPYQHSMRIAKNFVHPDSQLQLFDDMDHNSMDFNANIATPIQEFLNTIDRVAYPPLFIDENRMPSKE